MANDTFNYGVQALYCGGPSPYSANFETLVTQQLESVQSAAVSLTYPRIEAFGWDGGGTQELQDRPRAELSFSYIWGSGVNERNMGLTVAALGGTSALSNINTEHNYYLLFNLDHQDLVGYSGWNNRVMALGNGLLTHYQLSAAVGQPTIVNATIGALNLLLQPSGSGQPLPAIAKQAGTATTGLYTLPFAHQTQRDYFESRPAAIQLTFDSGSAIGVVLSGANACPLQSFSFSLDLPREEVKDLGWAYPNDRPARWPVSVAVQADAYLTAFQLDAINRFGCPDSGLNFSVRFNDACGLDSDAFTFQFNGAKLDTQSIASQIGNCTRVSFNWSLKIYDINRVGAADPGFYITATGVSYTGIIFPQVDYVSGSSPLVLNLGTGCYLTILSGPGVLQQNSVFVTDEASSVVVRAVSIDGTDTKDITLTIA